MRIIIVAIFAAFCMLGFISNTLAGTYQSNGSYVGTPSPVITAAFAAFPNGGDGLVDAIRQLLINNPALADDVAFVASRGNAAQQTAAAAGMAQAVIVMSTRGNDSGIALVTRAAQLSGNAAIQTAVLEAVGTANQGLYGVNAATLGQVNAATLGVKAPTPTVAPTPSCANIVSPSSPCP